jgi:membrane protein implicated in regulation of membrane protease activity
MLTLGGKAMGFVVVNIIGLIMFILAIVTFALADSLTGVAMGCAISVVWLLFTIVANVHIFRGKRSTEKLKDSARGHLFDAQIERLSRQYESIMSREEYFQENVEEGSGVRNLYEDIKKQAQSNMDSAIGFIQTYDYYTRPQPVYLDNLCRQGDELVRKFNILVEKMVDIDTNLSSLDMKYVDDVIECMNSMRQETHS